MQTTIRQIKKGVINYDHLSCRNPHHDRSWHHTKEELQRIFDNRERWYQVNATYSVLAGETPEESADRVMRILKKWSPQFLPKEEV